MQTIPHPPKDPGAILDLGIANTLQNEDRRIYFPWSVEAEALIDNLITVTSYTNLAKVGK